MFRAQIAGDVDRDVAHQSTVRQDLVFHLHRREGTRNRHAGAHRGGEVALLEYDHAAGDHVRRDCAIRYGQLVEIRLESRARDIDTQQIFDIAGIDQTAGGSNAVRRDAEFKVIAVSDTGALLFDRLEVTTALAADDLLPIDADEKFFELSGGYSRSVTAADERAHAGAGDAIDGYVQFLEHLQHADMRTSLRAPTREHEANARPAVIFRGRSPT